MTAQQLHNLTQPLFDKHPSARPNWFFFFFDHPDTPNEICYLVEHIEVDRAELILTGHLVQWLAECDEKEGIEVVPNCGHSGDKWVLWSRFGNELLGGGPTLLHALVAACMEVEE